MIIHAIKKGWFDLAEFLVKKYFNPNNIDLYDPFVKARKKLPQ